MPEEAVLSFLCEVLGVPKGSLAGTEELHTFEEWNSLAAMSLIAYADENGGIVLSPEKMMACRTVSDVAALVSGTA